MSARVSEREGVRVRGREKERKGGRRGRENKKGGMKEGDRGVWMEGGGESGKKTMQESMNERKQVTVQHAIKQSNPSNT